MGDFFSNFVAISQYLNFLCLLPFINVSYIFWFYPGLLGFIFIKINKSIHYFRINVTPLCCVSGYMLILIYKKEWVTKNMEVLLTWKRERKIGEIFKQKQLQEFKECRFCHLKVWNHYPKVFLYTFKTMKTNMIYMHHFIIQQLKFRYSENATKVS